MKKMLLSMQCFLFAILLSGCWDIQELKDLSFVIGIGVDLHEQGVELSLLEILTELPSGGQAEGGTVSGNANTRVISATGATITHCIEKLRGELEKHVSLSKVRYIVFSEPVLKKGIRHHMNFIVRHNEIDKIIYVLGTDKSAKTLLQGEKGKLFPFLKIEKQSPMLHTVHLWELIPQLVTTREGTIIPLIELGDEKIINLGASLLKLDKQMVRIEPELVRAINILSDRNVKKLKLFVGEDLAFEARQVKTDWQVKQEKVIVKVTMNGWIVQSKKSNPMLDKEQWEKRLAKIVNDDLEKVLNISKQYGVDVLKIGEKFRQKNWDVTNWEERLKDITFEVQSEVKILSGYGQSM